MFLKFIIDPFLDCVSRFGNYNAFCINEKLYTYHEFARYISKVRSGLQIANYRSKNIGLIVNDDIETYASIFAIWMEGCAYIPIHPMHPAERCSEIIAQAEIDLILSSTEFNALANSQILRSDRLKFTVLKPEPVITSEDELAYILFTSGSTGKPKGVPITRYNLGNFMKAFWEIGITITHTDRCLQGYDLTFDLSVQSFLVPLTKGACTYTIPHDQIKYSYVFGLLDEHQLTVLPMPPSLIRFLRPYFDEIDFSCVRYNLLGAEASPIDLINEWSNCIPLADIYNCYGPTEATIYCTYSKFNRQAANKSANGLMSIGKPMHGITAIIVNENREVQDINVKGELCVSGKQLTSGYLNNPEKNKESFFEMEYNKEKTRFYKTGDLCIIDNDGDILYLGRQDYQVKVHGFRIELGEIEFYAREFLNGTNALALANEDSVRGTEIILIVEDNAQDPKPLSEHLKLKLPYYMIPSNILYQDQFPLNANGKVDRNKLKIIINI
jgi:D-alanine--poly(phosphoribitol) ligase subunit 1